MIPLQTVSKEKDNRVSIHTKQEEGTNGTLSELKIQRAAITDSGTYSCSPSNAQDAFVKVHVINGKSL